MRGACSSDTAAHAPPCQQWFGGQPSEKLTFCYRLHPMISDLCFPEAHDFVELSSGKGKVSCELRKARA